MSWAKLDDHFYGNGKVLAAGLAATGLYARSLSYAAGHETDGHITRDVAMFLAGGEQELFDRLVGVELWSREGDGFMIHDYLEFNPSARELDRNRRQSAARVRRYRERLAEEPVDGSDSVTRNRNGSVTRNKRRPVTMGRVGSGSSNGRSSSDHGRSEEVGTVARAREERFARWWDAYPLWRREKRSLALKAFIELDPDDGLLEKMLAALAWQVQRWKDGEPKYTPHPTTYLHQRRWEDEPPPAPPKGHFADHNPFDRDRKAGTA